MQPTSGLPVMVFPGTVLVVQGQVEQGKDGVVDLVFIDFHGRYSYVMALDERCAFIQWQANCKTSSWRMQMGLSKFMPRGE
ncbi:hypothetical protein PS3A_20910 [Pseudomonas sp. 3A(2025)]